MDENNILLRLDAKRTWDQAHRAAGIQRVLNLFRPRSDDLLSFEEVKKRLRLSRKSHRGLQEIPVEQIRGSVGRYRDFTATFLPKKASLRERWERIAAVSQATGLPPIEVYQVGEAYFVLDGNHRVSVARQHGYRTIQAYVWEFPTPVGLSSTADLDEVLIRAEYAEFLEHTQLGKLRPGVEIEFTTPGRYRELEYQIALYQRALEQIDGEPLSYEDAVTAWYDMIYTPAIQIIRKRGALERFPGRTEADLFVWIWRYRQALQQSSEEASLSRAADDLPREGLRGWVKRAWRTAVNWLRGR